MSTNLTAHKFTKNPEEFLDVGLSGTRWLSFRDIPELINKYVQGTTALDYGCGPGFSTKFLKSLGLDVDGVDVDENLIESAKKADPDGKYVVINSGEIPAEDNHYDLVFSSWVYPYISTKQELQKITREMARVMKKSGIFISIIAGKDSVKYDWLSLSTCFEENKNLYSGCKIKAQWKDNGLFFDGYYWTEEDYKDVFFSSGLRTLKIHRPLGKNSDGYDWVSERERYSCDIWIAEIDV